MRPCRYCTVLVANDGEVCGLCRRFNRQPEPLEGGYWKREGLISKWVQLAPVVEKSGLPECGTTAAYHAHLKRGEKTCLDCRRAYAAYRASKRPVRVLAPCGTRAAFQRHRNQHETPCDECRASESEYQKARRRNKKEAA